MGLFRLTLGLVIALLLAPLGAESKGSAPPNPAAPDELFSQPRVLELTVVIPGAGLAALNKDPKTYVKGILREGENVYANVGIRLKGNGAFQAQEKKPGLAVKFNEFASGLRFHGHAKIILDNAHQDPTFLSEAIGSAMFRAAGVPAAKVTFARVALNGRDLGLYVVEEAINHEFLAEHFRKTKGNLYEGSHSDITDRLEPDSGENSKDQNDLTKLAAAATEKDPAERLKKLGVVLDIDRFISFVAVEVLSWHPSGYSMGRNNYRLYHDPASDQMVFIPHSLDQLFTKASAPLMPEWKGLIAKAVLDNPEGQRRYRARMVELLGNACKLEKLQARLDNLAGRIRPSLGADAAQVKAFDAALGFLRERIAQRAHFLEYELKKPVR